MPPAAKNSASEVSTEPLRTVQKEAARVTLLGLALDLFLDAIKIIGGILFASFALVADGVHSLSDAATDLFVLAIARTAYAPADTGHPTAMVASKRSALASWGSSSSLLPFYC